MPVTIYVKPEDNRLTPAREKDRIEIAKLTQGRPLRAVLSKPRNSKVHRLYFAAINAAAKHWPENEEPLDLSGDAELLRSFLQVKAGWCDRIYFPVEAKDSVIRLIEEVRSTDRFAFVRTGIMRGQPALVVFISKSVDYGAADDSDFEPVKTDVLARIESVLGCTVQELVEADEDET